MSDSLFYKLRSGKPIKFFYIIKCFLKLSVPKWWYRIRRERLLAQASKRPDYEYLKKRVDYYMRHEEPWQVGVEDQVNRQSGWVHYTGRMDGYRRKMFSTAYYFDQYDVTRWFPGHLRWSYCPGDVYFTPEVPTMVKSRLLSSDNQNSVLLKLDKLRHFMYVNDTKSFREKSDCSIFRGKIRCSRLRSKFMEMFLNHPMCDCGVVGNEGCPESWVKPKKTIREHLDYKFIIALEGNDVASNLKWVMSSNSLAVMTRPTCETWFMEGTLIPDYHYVEIKDDFSDFEEKLRYYIEHPEKAEEIIRHAHEYVAQFRDDEREELLQIMVMERYLQVSGQL